MAIRNPSRILTASVVALAVALMVGPGCENKKIIECVDPAGNPVNCTPAEAGTGTGGGSNTGTASTGSTGPTGPADTGTGTGTGTGGDTGAPGTDPDDPNGLCPGSKDDYGCGNRCGQYCHVAPCQCDEQCFSNGDCCDDFFDVCEDVSTSTGDTGDTGDTGGNPDYTFPSPFDVQALSYNDCKGMASGNSSWCDTYDCRGIVNWNFNLCTTKDCKGIASANKSYCDSYDCKGIADGRLCIKEQEACITDAGSDSSAKSACESGFDACISNAKGYCKSYYCRAIVTGDAGYCSSGGSDNGNCKAIVKKNSSYCWYGG